MALAVAELALGNGLSTSQLPAWRQTAAKLILLFADEEDGGQQNEVGSEAKYKDSGHAEYYIKLLTKPSEEIGFVLTKLAPVLTKLAPVLTKLAPWGGSYISVESTPREGSSPQPERSGGPPLRG